MKEPGGRQPEPRWLHLVAGALMAGGPVWHYLYANHYPFARVEASLLPGAAALLGAALAAGARRIGGLLGGVIFGSLLFAFTDLQFDLQEYFFTAGVLLGCIGLSLLLRDRRATIACLSLGAFYAASLPRPALTPPHPHPVGATTAVPQNGKPLLLHIILDEQWGIGGLRAAGDTATAAFLEAFYLGHGFELYEGAYSRLQYSMESIPATLSLGAPVGFNPESSSRPYWRSLRRNPYFARLQELGYRIDVYQSTYLDYCRSEGTPVAGCSVVSGNSIANIGYLPGSWSARAVLAGHYFLDVTSHLYARLHPEAEVWRRSITGAGLSAAESVRIAIAARPPGGTAIFVHLMLPHRPIDVDSACRTLEDPGERVYGDYPTEPGEPDWPRTLLLEAGQIRCTHRVLAGIIRAIDATVGQGGAIVIVHGDHGARLHPAKPKSEALSALTRDELNAIFPTLLAIRRPGVPAAVHPEPVPLQDFIWELAGNGFAGEVKGPWRHYLRKEPSKENPADTLRALDASEMPWVRPPR